jgi:hypothetical protein
VALLLGAIAVADLLRNRERATRWREYAFWLACGLLGALFAVGNDLVTSQLSEAYFALGKGLASDDSHKFMADVVLLAIRAGFVAGLAIGGALLIANNPDKELPQLPYSELASFILVPALAAIAAAPICGACANLDIQGLSSELRQVLSAHEVDRFLMIQRIHIGLYAGALIGTAGAFARVRRKRRALASNR